MSNWPVKRPPAARRGWLVVLWALAVTVAAAQSDALDDPMRPYRPESSGGSEPAARGFELSAVLISPARRIAVINGAFYREGDTVNGAEITRIEPAAVRLRRGGEDLIVYLNRERTRAPANLGEPAS